jgi:copper chaperone CopZ
MRQLATVAVVMFLTGFGIQAARAEKVEIKGVHLCCPSCVKSVAGILSKVDGVSAAKCDRAEKTVTFTATDAKTARKAFDALRKGGFFGQATCEGKEMKTKNTASKNKAAKVTVNDVHVCCGNCKKAVEKLFKDATITYTGDGPQRSVTITGENLTPAGVLQTLRNAGLNGTVSKD